MPPAQCLPPPSRCPTCGKQQRTIANGILLMDQSARRLLSTARSHLNLEVRRDRVAFCDMAGKVEINLGGWGALAPCHLFRAECVSIKAVFQLVRVACRRRNFRSGSPPPAISGTSGKNVSATFAGHGTRFSDPHSYGQA